MNDGMEKGDKLFDLRRSLHLPCQRLTEAKSMVEYNIIQTHANDNQNLQMVQKMFNNSFLIITVSR